ncbi:hypothetical protein LPB86_07570 [Pedobacter sp. MC2016-14]|uniref:hypothetical protein n=1 Tax=Pedobacter sp. MC2016-14 TaxID=2897327 RepID=UPI001E36D6FB|nr:hypothetical protein [Pedobacter sp. MC2016-14]MCD0488083.1 hypothetical protein [Pedobacter sp. MC2016-14]
MSILKKVDVTEVIPSWICVDFLPDSSCCKNEIYLKEGLIIEGLIEMFYDIFKKYKKNIQIYNYSWWDFCLDTWDPRTDQYDYELSRKSEETKWYLQILFDSSIEIGYDALCICNDWNIFLKAILKCLTTHKAPYSPIFFDRSNNFFFYFHHSGSIGIYYLEQNDAVIKILDIAKQKYDLK